MGRGPAWIALALAVALGPPVLLTGIVTGIAIPLMFREPAPHWGLDWGSGSHHERIMAEANPAAVLAWAKANCDAGLELASHAPRTQLEIVLQVAAIYDAESRHRGVADVCAQALEHFPI